MKKIFFTLIVAVFLSACSPSDSTIQTAIAETQAEWTAVPTQTSYATYTLAATIAIEVTRVVIVTTTYTSTPANTPTNTSTPTNTLSPTNTPNAAKTATAISALTKTALAIPTITPSPIPPHYVRILGRIWSGVKVYYGTGTEKAYGFEILGGSENCPFMPSGRGIKVLYPDGTEEWKDRMFILSSDLFYVLEDDPAISALEWFEFYDCP